MPKKLVSHNHLKKSEYIFLTQPFWANSVKEIVAFVLLTDKIFACVRDYCNMDWNLFDIFCKIATRKNLLKRWYINCEFEEYITLQTMEGVPQQVSLPRPL